MHPLAERIKQKDIRALAQAITLVENDDPDKRALMSDVFSFKKQCRLVGITGSRGVGQCSLVNKLFTLIRVKGQTVAVIAVNPTRPFSGGALLVDRVSMDEHFTDEGVFIRVMAT